MNTYNIHPDFLKIKVGLPLYQPLLPLINRVIDWTQQPEPLDASALSETKRTIPGYRGEPIGVTISRPAGAAGNLPCLLYFHGGGMVMKAAACHKNNARKYAKGAGCVVVAVDYRLAGSDPFPGGVEDCYAGYQWVLDNVESLGVDAGRIAVGGDSAGGALAVAVGLMARDRVLPAFCFQLLLYPMADARMQTESMKQFTDTPMWDARRNKKAWQIYLRDEANAENPYASPMATETFRGLAAAYVEVAEFDCLRDEGIALAKAMERDGIAVTLALVARTPHGFDFAQNSSITLAAMEQRIQALVTAFGG